MARAPTFEVYKITHKESGIAYIGCTTKGVAARFKDHVRMAGWKPAGYLHRAIVKHGVEAFEVTQIAVLNSAEEMLALEVELIASMGTLGPKGYNITTGGERGFSLGVPGPNTGRKMSDATKEKIRLSALKQWANPVAIAHISTVRKGRKTSDSTKALIADTSKARWRDSKYKARLTEKFTEAQISRAHLTALQMREKWADPEFRSQMLAARASARAARHAARAD